MTRREKAKLFGRLSDADQREIVHKAHQAADAQQAEIHIYVRVAYSGPIGADGFALVRMEGADGWAPGPHWHQVRTIKPRPVRDIGIQAVMRADSRRRSAPWEGRGRHD